MRDIYLPDDNFKKYQDIPSINIIKGNVRNPYLTIFIPTYKRDETLKVTIESAINQQYTGSYEILIVSNDPDGDKSETRKLIESFRDERISFYVNTDNLGLCGNWNRGVELAQGEYICMIHDDDMLSPWYLQAIEKAISENNEPSVLGVDYHTFDSDHMPLFQQPQELHYREVTKKSFFFGQYINIAGMAVKKTFILAQGGYRDEYYPNEDTILIYQALLSGKVIRVEHVLAGYRQEVNLSLSEKTMWEIVVKTEETRRFIAEHELFAKKWMKHFDKEYLYSYIQTANKQWGMNLNSEKMFKELGFSDDKTSTVKTRIMSLFVRAEQWRWLHQ